MALQISRSAHDEDCVDCIPSCARCGERLVPASDRSMVCVGCLEIAPLEVDVNQIDLFEEDPDRRPYIWDLEE